MNSLQIFTSVVPELEELSDRPKILFYPSSGYDFRPVTYFTEAHINKLKQSGQCRFNKPEVMIFSCIGYHVEQLKERLNNGEVLHRDAGTTITVKEYETLFVEYDIDLELKHRRLSLTQDRKSWHEHWGRQVLLLKLNVKGIFKDTQETYQSEQTVLYFEHENIDVFEKILLPYFDIDQLIVTREGCGFGGCRLSIINYIYRDNYPNFFRDQGFKPSCLVLFNVLHTNASKNRQIKLMASTTLVIMVLISWAKKLATLLSTNLTTQMSF